MEGYTEHMEVDKGQDTYFPLPYFLVFCGYTLILIMDKVLFDSHAILDGAHGHGHNHEHVDQNQDLIENVDFKNEDDN